MSNNITQIYYEEIDEAICSVDEAAKYYYYSNNLDDIDLDDYEEYETNQIKLRNTIIGNAKLRGEIDNIKLDSSIMALSTLKNKVVIFVDII